MAHEDAATEPSREAGEASRRAARHEPRRTATPRRAQQPERTPGAFAPLSRAARGASAPPTRQAEHEEGHERAELPVERAGVRLEREEQHERPAEAGGAGHGHRVRGKPRTSRATIGGAEDPTEGDRRGQERHQHEKSGRYVERAADQAAGSVGNQLLPARERVQQRNRPVVDS